MHGRQHLIERFATRCRKQHRHRPHKARRREKEVLAGILLDELSIERKRKLTDCPRNTVGRRIVQRLRIGQRIPLIDPRCSRGNRSRPNSADHSIVGIAANPVLWLSMDSIRAALPIDDVDVAPAVQSVITTSTAENIRPRAADEHIVAIAADDERAQIGKTLAEAHLNQVVALAGVDADAADLADAVIGNSGAIVHGAQPRRLAGCDIDDDGVSGIGRIITACNLPHAGRQHLPRFEQL